MQNKGISRRQFLKFSAAATAGAVAATVVPGVLAAQDMTYTEAPVLADMVSAGDLPPVEERLPLNPKVLPVYDSIGTYGGTWRRGFRGPSDRFGVHTTVAEHLLEMYQEDGGDLTLINNVAESYEVNDEATVFTWNLREGHKWSDGVELSSENALWWYDNVLNNETLVPSGTYDNVRQQQNLTGIEANGQWSFTTSYSVPNPTLPLGVVRGEAWGLIGGLNFMVPHHYLEAFHPDFADPDELQAVIDENSVQEWTQLWLGGPIGMFAFNPDLPIVGPFPVANRISTDTLVQTRNPYYFQVDEEGNQLPYIDTIEHAFYENQESFNLMLISGDIDLQFRRVQVSDLPLLLANAEENNYNVLQWITDQSLGYQINPTPRSEDGNIDEAQADIVNQADFRRALGLAINREEIAVGPYDSFVIPRGAAPVPGSPIYKEEYETLWATYDPEQANTLLDGMGLDQRDGDGFRLRPDGERLVLRLDVDSAPGSADELQHQLVKEYWEDVGVNTVINTMERSLRESLSSSGQNSVTFNNIGNTSVPLSFNGFHPGPGGGWGLYKTAPGSELAVAPPEGDPIYEMWDLIDQAYQQTDFDEGHRILMEALDIYYDQAYRIGTIGASATVVVVTDRMRNVPETVINANALMRVNMAQPAQIWIEE